MTVNAAPGRRRFLRGLGACLALPVLASLLPSGAEGGPDEKPRRLLHYYVPNGFNMGAWGAITATLAGKELTSQPSLPRFLAPLSDAGKGHDFRKKLLVLSGLDNAPGNYRTEDKDSNGAHFQQTASFLTGTHVDSSPFSVAKSIDQVVAESFGYVTPHRSLQLGLHPGSNGNCSGNWPCAYLGFVSWADAQTPLAQLSDPYEMFTTLFASNATGVSAAELARRKARKLRVLDVVGKDAKTLHGKLGTSDRAKLEQYLTAVDEAELKASAMSAAGTCEVSGFSSGNWTYPEKVDLMADLMALAFKCDLTRVITFMRQAGGASFPGAYDWVEHEGKKLMESKHTYSHWSAPLASEPGTLQERQAAYLAKLEAINTWELERFAYLLGKLDAYVEPDGKTLLDQCVVVFGSELGEPDKHLANDLPIIVAGSGGGAFITGKHVSFNSGVPVGQTKPDTLADFHITVATQLGVSMKTHADGKKFGEDGTKVLPGLGA